MPNYKEIARLKAAGQSNRAILYNKNVLSEHELLWNKIGAYSTIPTDIRWIR